MWAERALVRTALAGALAAAALALVGLPPVDLHGPLHRFGIMDPACGMTRAFAALVRGRFAAAWEWNPGSYPLALTAVFVLGDRAVRGGRDTVALLRRHGRSLVVAAAFGVLALAGVQQAHAGALRAGPCASAATLPRAPLSISCR